MKKRIYLSNFKMRMEDYMVPSDMKRFTLSKEELSILSSCASHVLYEFAMTPAYNLVAATGWEKTKAEAFAATLRNKYRQSSANNVLDMTDEELRYCIIIIHDAIKKIDWEFQTLTGYTLEEAAALNVRLKAIKENIPVDNLPPRK